MPIYDVKCFACGYEGIETVRIADLEAWDLSARCPSCLAEKGGFRRIIKQAPSSHDGKTLSHYTAKKGGPKKNLISSADRDDMMHKGAKNVDQAQVAAARESVAKGEFEGF